MVLHSITERGIEKLVNRLLDSSKVVAPIEERGFFKFDTIRKFGDIRLDYTNTRLPPKFIFLPQLETMFRYSLRDGKITPYSEDTRETVLFAVRPCDASSLTPLDSIMSGEYVDNYYESKRKRTIVIALSCRKPMNTCFCNVFKTGPIEGTGADLTLTRIRRKYVAKAASSKGKDFIARNKDLFERSSKSEREQYSSIKKRTKKSMRKYSNLDKAWTRVSQEFSDPLWSELAKRCIGCGICSFVCPTCYCFDVCEVTSGASGSRLRGWDSCRFGTFSRMSSGLDPRPTEVERTRHRYYHKFQYVPKSFGVKACVGCGRCVALCPVDIGVTEVLGV